MLGDEQAEGDLEQRARSLVQKLGVEGFLRHAVPRQFGGVGEQVEARDLCILREDLARGDALADNMFALQALGSLPISLAGSAAQKQTYLPPVANGAAIAAFAITEPEAGSGHRVIANNRSAPGRAIYIERRSVSFPTLASLSNTYSARRQQRHGQLL